MDTSFVGSSVVCVNTLALYFPESFYNFVCHFRRIHHLIIVCAGCVFPSLNAFEHCGVDVLTIDFQRSCRTADYQFCLHLPKLDRLYLENYGNFHGVTHLHSIFHYLQALRCLDLRVNVSVTSANMAALFSVLLVLPKLIYFGPPPFFEELNYGHVANLSAIEQFHSSHPMLGFVQFYMEKQPLKSDSTIQRLSPELVECYVTDCSCEWLD